MPSNDCIKDRTPTAKQLEIARRQLTTPEYGRLKVTDWATLARFQRDFLQAFAPAIRECACCFCVPPWLLASVLLGEVSAMDKYLGIDERTLEGLGFGSSVGLGQIRPDTAVRRGLTPTAKRFDAEVAATGKLMEEIAKTPMVGPSGEPYTPGPWIHDPSFHRSLVMGRIREELLNPLLNICASAKYLRGLCDDFAVFGKVRNYVRDREGAEPWGTFDFGKLGKDCDLAWDKASDHPSQIERRKRIAKLFGAAHNDDATNGFAMGYGLTQGENAGNIADDLHHFGLVQEFELEDCPPRGRRREAAPGEPR